MYWWHWWPFILQMLLPNNMDYLTAVVMMLNNIYFILFRKISFSVQRLQTQCLFEQY